ncbi:hypothetical protein [Streptomyces sp. IB201691-2A2]|uniref:hypothetical protein n=1 Tax=Streptomyces sp. IB201691-2A2 TaxID=2561920 RepID=UPI00117C933F|nr:hypothetical protein [Streptomyces sp. IB201691-2A2]TRO56119.1 hypothetical protein E4K73_47835 [Streptomyces sp. IB201691-2A2]
MGSYAKAGELVALTGAARVWVWVTAVVTGLAAVGLTLVAVLADLDTAGQVASVAGAVAGLVALLVSVIALFRGGSGGGSGTGRKVRAGRGAIVSGGNITGSALGKNSKVTGPRTVAGTPPAQRDGDDVRARRDGIAAGGDITDSALGEGSER